jgi:four helix bundle protein
MHNFKELRIWQDSIDLVEDIYKMTKDLPKNEEFGLISQMRRCSVSIPSNIAEGSGRESDKDFRRFIGISLSSSFELETQLIIANRIGYIKKENFNQVIGELSKIQKMIFMFRKKINITTKLKNFIVTLFI